MKKTLITSLILVAMLTSGCAALVIGGAAAGGYAVAKDERSARQITDDASITAAVKTKFLADKYVQGLSIDVDTYNRVVTLSGTLSSNFSRERASELAGKTRGVVQVRNNIQLVN